MSIAPKKIWRLDCQVEIYYLELPPQDQTLANSVEYIRADKVQEMLQQQREACARKSKKVIDEYFRTSGHNKMMQGRIENACLNATGESDG